MEANDAPSTGETNGLGHDAETHLAALSDRQRESAPGHKAASTPAPKRAGRAARLRWVRLGLRFEELRREVRSPRKPLGRLWASFELLSKRQLVQPRVLSLLLPIAAVWALNKTDLAEDDRLLWAVATAAFTGSFLGLTALLWSDYLNSPRLARKIRRAIVRNPERVLPTTLGSTQSELFAHDDRLEHIPRGELLDEVIPGILQSDRRDVQIIVGDPGSGKTTALVGLSGLLARIGIVPILVPLRGETNVVDLVAKAREIFNRQVYPYVRSDNERDALWRWLRDRNRIAILTDDIDQIGTDGERGFVLRRALEVLATEDVAVVVTARPAGIPAGVAATAIDLGALDEEEAIDHLERASDSSAARRGPASSREQLAHWVREGRLTEVPFYLELLAVLASGDKCPPLERAGPSTSGTNMPGQYRRRPDGTYEWNPVWVRFMLLEEFYVALRKGDVRRWLGIEPRERRSSLEALEGAALGMLLATGLAAQADVPGSEKPRPKRARIEEFLDPDDRAGLGATSRQRRDVSAHEVVDSGERMRLLDREHDGTLEFSHRIMQAYLASRRLVEIERARINAGSEAERTSGRSRGGEAVEVLLDSHHPEKLTAHMTLTFAALGAVRRPPHGDLEKVAPGGQREGNDIITSLNVEAERKLPVEKEPGTGAVLAGTADPGPGIPKRLDPRQAADPEDRVDPDDALIKLTTAAEISRAIGSAHVSGNPEQEWADLEERLAKRTDPMGSASATQERIVVLARKANGATRWTKLSAIRALAALRTDARWKSIWEFTRDPDYAVRRAACAELEKSALDAYRALEEEIDELILHAGARSLRNRPLLTGDAGSDAAGAKRWDEIEHILPLKALGWMLPAIVTGLRESPSADETSAPAERAALAQRARRALDRLVALAFSKKGNYELEAALAQGFKGDAMRHTDNGNAQVSGPGWVADNRSIVTDICVPNATFWYARMLLHQALGLYAIVASDTRAALDSYDHAIETEVHPLARTAALQARTAVERGHADSGRWRGLIWDDEGEVVSRRPSALDDRAARLVADVTLLLNLNDASRDSLVEFGKMEVLPHCLTASSDRSEILGKGCEPGCGYGLCPYKQPPPDEPNAHRGVSRAFCRHQRRIAQQPPWQPSIGKKTLGEFWEQMERRART